MLAILGIRLALIVFLASVFPCLKKGLFFQASLSLMQKDVPAVFGGAGLPAP
jgi:hypothetical protein